MRLFALVYHGVDIARSAYSRAPASEGAKDRDRRLHAATLDVARQVGASDQGGVGKVDDHISGRDVVDQIPQEHLGQELRRDVAVAAIEIVRVVKCREQGDLVFLEKLGVQR